MTVTATDLRGQPGWAGSVRRHGHLRGDRVALRSGADLCTYAELDQMVDRMTAALADIGVRKGDRVVMLMGNSIEMVEILLAINRMGAIAVPINFRLVAEEVRYVVVDSGAAALITDVERAEVAGIVRTSLDVTIPCLVHRPGGVRGTISPATDGDPSPSRAGDGALWLDRIVATTKSGPVEATLGPDAPAFIMYTSGTTGRPKGAVLTHGNLFCQAFNYVVAAQFVDESAITMISVPIFHIAAIGGIVPTLTLGATCLIMPSGAFNPAELIDVVEQQGVTDMFLVPTQWQAVCALPGLLDRRFKLRSIGWGASPTTEGVLRDMARYFPGTTIVALFGQTEMAPVTCALRGEDSLRKMGSVGTPVITVDVRIVDDAMNDVPCGEVGEIVYRGPNLMDGYWNNPTATEEAFRGGWFHSGDLVRRDGDGFIFVVDRKKDMIVSGGENVYCAEVEEVLSGHKLVAEASVIGCPHPKWVETPVAYLIPVDKNRSPEPSEILEWCRERMAAFKRPTRIFVVDALPRNASGKVLKEELRADLARRLGAELHGSASHSSKRASA